MRSLCILSCRNVKKRKCEDRDSCINIFDTHRAGGSSNQTDHYSAHE